MSGRNRLRLTMCVTKLDKKTIDDIVKEAIKIEQGITYAEIANYEKRIKEKHYEPFNYEYVDWRGKIPYIPAPNEMKKKKKEGNNYGT
jgi:hypothetical protein